MAQDKINGHKNPKDLWTGKLNLNNKPKTVEFIIEQGPLSRNDEIMKYASFFITINFK